MLGLIVPLCICLLVTYRCVVRVWALDVWGELVPSKIHHSQFSRLGIQCPALIYVMFVWSGLVGLSVWLVCYGFHVYLFASSNLYSTTFTGVLCQLPSTKDICPGDDVTFTCETTINAVAWRVTPAVGDFSSCTVFHDAPSVIERCGPMDVFTAAVSGDNMTSTLSAQSVTDDLNGTKVECSAGDVDEEICIVGQRITVKAFH